MIVTFANMQETLILTHHPIMAKLERMAWEIYENHYREKTILLAGIEGTGEWIAMNLKGLIEKICPLIVNCCSLPVKTQDHVNVHDFIQDPTTVVIVVDDVLYSGKTMMKALLPFINAGVSVLEVAVLVNRTQRRYPIYPTYTGLNLATTLQEMVEVRQIENQLEVILR